MNNILIHIGSALLYGGAACCLLLLVNRILFLTPDFKGKTITVFMMFSLMVLVSTVYGAILPLIPWILIPLSILIVFLTGELQGILTQKIHIGSHPIDTKPHAFNLLSPVTTTDLVIHRYRIEHEKWRGKPFRIAHLTDLHANPALPLEYFENVLKTTEELEPDITVLTGDFICRPYALPILKKFLRPVAKTGTYAVLGNHDHWTDPAKIMKTIVDSGIHMLKNTTETLSIHGHELAITGFDYPWGSDSSKLPEPEKDLLHIVLSHTPENIYELARQSADIVFSGHFHAGQIRVPFFGPLVIPSRFGRRFDHGHFVINDTHLFVSAGVGAANPPLRIFCHPDLFIVDITAKE